MVARTPSSQHPMLTLVRTALVAAPMSLALFAPSCGGDDTNGSGSGGSSNPGGSAGTGGAAEGGMCLPDSGPEMGPPDMHCIDDDGGQIIGEANSCPTTAPLDAGMDALPGGHVGTEADDDDCKYHVKYTVGCVAVGQPVTFTVTLTSRADGSLVTGASPQTLEGFLGTSHILPADATRRATEISPGVYTIGPATFDKSGQWTVRFHFFETCADTEGSKHGHAAFLIDVP
jgi:hypothetical protein